MFEIAPHGYWTTAALEIPAGQRECNMWETILWIAAVIIGVFGILRLVRGDILMGIVLIVVALLVGPGGVSILS